MKGILKNKDNKWYVTKINYDNDIKFGVDYLVYQETFDINKKQPIIKLEEGKEVDFQIKFGCIEICDGECGMCDNAQHYAKLSITPNISDDFQIGPDGAFEFSEEEVEKLLNRTYKKRMKDKTFNTTHIDPIDYAKSKNNFYEINYPLDYKIIRDCEFCGEKVKEEFQPICDDCKEALKDLVLERKKYNNKYKNGNPG